MKNHITASAAASLARIAIAARVIYGVIVDMPDLLNAGWLSVLLGGVLALPAALAVSSIRRNTVNAPKTCIGQNSAKALCALFFLISVWDAAAVCTAVTGSASYIALNSVPAGYLMIPLFIMCSLCVFLNGNALGASAGLWNRILPCLLGIVFLLEAGSYHPAWLTPVLGPGPSKILRGAIQTAGWFTLPTALFLVSDPDDRQQSRLPRPVGSLLISAGISALVCLMHSMMTPGITDSNLYVRTSQLNLVLSNGRSTLALQFPAITLWFISLLYAFLFDVFTASIVLECCLPALGRRTCIVVTQIAVIMLSFSGFSGRNAMNTASGWLFLLEGMVIAVFALLIKPNKGGLRHAKADH